MMSALRAVLLMVLLTCPLAGCLVSLAEPIAPGADLPLSLLGSWQRTDAWGQPETLEITRVASGVYRARLQGEGELDGQLQTVDFTVAHHGRRWYATAGLPQRLGGHFALLGFELTPRNELVLYSLDVQRMLQDIDSGLLAGDALAIPRGEVLLVSSPLPQVLAYLDDPANSDLFVEVARYRSR